MTPLFSIILPTYNRASFIRTPIQSIINQTHTSWELIIIDDGSSDNTQQLVVPFLADKRINYYYQTNQERSVARNNGIKLAKGAYICFLDSDDYYLPKHLESLYQEIIKNDSSRYVFVTKRSYKKGDIEQVENYNNDYEGTFKNHLINHAIISSPPIQCMCIKKEILENVKFSNKWLPYSECNHFSFELLSRGYEYYFINTHTVVMLNHDSNTTIDSESFYKSKLDFISLFSKRINAQNENLIKETKNRLYLYLLINTKNSIRKVIYIVKWAMINPKIFISKSILLRTFKVK